jgi:FixJ family two-component response regulator
MTTRDKSTVFIVDDDASLREAIRDLVESVGLHCEDFATAQEFLRGERTDGPSCLILDVRLPRISGLDLQDELKRTGVRIPIIFISAHADIPIAVRAMKAGAVEFLAKPFREQELLDAVERSIGRDRRGREERRNLDELRERYKTLSVREREVMSLVVAGMRNLEVAAQLRNSETTVKIQRARVMEKMQAHSLPELVRMADRLKSL